MASLLLLFLGALFVWRLAVWLMGPQPEDVGAFVGGLFGSTLFEVVTLGLGSTIAIGIFVLLGG